MIVYRFWIYDYQCLFVMSHPRCGGFVALISTILTGILRTYTYYRKAMQIPRLRGLRGLRGINLRCISLLRPAVGRRSALLALRNLQRHASFRPPTAIYLTI